jgi:hypothetical protein
MTDLSKTKDYPTNYSSDAVAVLDAMSFTKGKSMILLGSMSLRSQQYAGDYDGYETVELRESSDEAALDSLASRFKEMIKELRGMKNVYIGDIKGGIVPEWRVVSPDTRVSEGKVKGWNAVDARKVVDTLEESKVITREAAESLRRKCLPSLTPEQYFELKNEAKYHIVRWTAAEALHGSKRLEDGRTYTLQSAFSSPGITKMDVIALVQNSRYTEFSVVYQFKNNGKVLNNEPIDITTSLRENILAYKVEGNPFKVLKRQFSLAKWENDEKTLKRLSPILNSDLGRLYVVLSDVATLILLLDEHSNVPLDKVRFEIDQFKSRLSNIYSLESYLKGEHDLLGDINAALKISDKKTLARRLEGIADRLETYLTDSTEAKLKGGRAVYGRRAV